MIVNEAMRISTGAFKSTPVKSLAVLTNEADLNLRRNELLLRYYYKLKHHFVNPAYSSVVNQNLELFFYKQKL